MIKIFKESKVIAESSLSRVIDKISKHDCGIISASRYKDEFDNILTKEDNKERNTRLFIKLSGSGYDITLVKGAFKENFGTPEEKEIDEDSFFVSDINDTGNLRSDLITLGKKYFQDSILYIPKSAEIINNQPVVSGFLIGVKDDAYPGFGVEVELPVLKLGKDDYEFLTRVDNRPFYFRQFVEIYNRPETSIGKYYYSELLKKYERTEYEYLAKYK